MPPPDDNKVERGGMFRRKMKVSPLPPPMARGKDREKAREEKARAVKMGREAEEERADRPREAIA